MVRLLLPFFAVAALAASACAPSPRPVTAYQYAYVEEWEAPSDPPPARRHERDRRRRSRLPSMVAVGAFGALVGGFLGSVACADRRETDAECQDRAVEGALIGGGIGVLLGATAPGEP